LFYFVLAKDNNKDEGNSLAKQFCVWTDYAGYLLFFALLILKFMFLNYHNKSLNSPEVKYIYFNDNGFIFLLIFGISVLIIEGSLIVDSYIFY